MDAPDGGLAEHFVFVQSHERAHAAWRERIHPNGGAGHVAGVAAVWGQTLHFSFVHATVPQLIHGLFGGAIKRQILRLVLHVEQHHAVLLSGKRQGAAFGAQTNEVHRHQVLALVDKLEVSVLPVDA